MSDPNPGSLYQQQYDQVCNSFEDGLIDKCIAEAKHNLTDPTLPPFYIIKYCIVLACAHDTWDKADGWRRSAEHMYQTCLDNATRKQDTSSLETLSDLRMELDELHEFRMEDMTGMTKEERDSCGVEDNSERGQVDVMDYDEDLAGVDFEDSAAVAEAENDVEVAAERIRLPIRSASELANPVTPVVHEDPSDRAICSNSPAKDQQIATLAKQLRRQKSSKFKGGAFHASAFAKSMGKSSAQSRLNLLDVDWSSKKEDEKH
ncbi:hypothetical protein NX059_000999 [Plenodomus lindquistii]|nr:hypothetical protein NX059_000999 [Plenodomus lindquistii]